MLYTSSQVGQYRRGGRLAISFMYRLHLPHWLSTLPLLARGMKLASNSVSMRCKGKSQWGWGWGWAGSSGKRATGRATGGGECAVGDSTVWQAVHVGMHRIPTTDQAVPQGLQLLAACLDVCHEEGKLGLELVEAVGHNSLLVGLALQGVDGQQSAAVSRCGTVGCHGTASQQLAARACRRAAGRSKHSSYRFKLKLSRPTSRPTLATRSIWLST